MFLVQTGNDILISYGFEDDLNTIVTFLSCWFTRPKLLIHVENTRKLNLLNMSPAFFFDFWAFQNMRIFEELTDLQHGLFCSQFLKQQTRNL